MLTGKIALVTGASRGIGKSVALTLASYGATVIVNYNGSKDKAEAVVEEIVKQGGTAKAYGCNVSDYAAVETMMKDIVKELEKPGRDPRDDMPKPILRSDVMEMEDLKEGMILKGTVRNVIDFGAFVDIGVHQDGLVHISQMSDKYIKHPLEVVSVGDIVEVKVLGVDLAKKRIQLTMKGI